MALQENEVLSRAGVRDFEASLGFPEPPALAGGIVKAKIVEVGGVSPGTIIRLDQDWKVDVVWYIWGWLLDLPVCGISFDWEWVLHICLESMGPGPEYKLPAGGSKVHWNDHTVILPSLWKFEHSFEIPKGTVKPGTYKAVLALTAQCGGTDTPVPVAGFDEIRGMIQFYKV